MPASSERRATGIEILLPLLLANGLTLLVAELRGFGPVELLWPFWFQNVWIGLAQAHRIRHLRDYSTEGLSIGGRPAEPSPELPRKIAGFFILHYGFFHFVYLVFLLAFTFASDPDGTIEVTDGQTGESSRVHLGKVEGADWLGIGLLAAAFAFAERGEARQATGAGRKPNIGTLMFMPYLRIVPMHLTIILAMALGSGGAVWLFVALKTLAEGATVFLMRRAEGR
jgi:hypothetical protein